MEAEGGEAKLRISAQQANAAANIYSQNEEVRIKVERKIKIAITTISITSLEENSVFMLS
ncbi:MAG: hypothetical protein O9293_10035 [Porphyrobacter sp.]|nr:hypothetical protein [Porphyrobacter sp.]